MVIYTLILFLFMLLLEKREKYLRIFFPFYFAIFIVFYDACNINVLWKRLLTNLPCFINVKLF